MSRVGAASLVLLAAAAGCSGNKPPYDCGQVPPCGGNLVGTWSVVTSCLGASQSDTAFAQAFCPGNGTTTGAFLESATVAYAGAWSFTSDLNYSVALFITGSNRVACDDGRSCAQQDADIKAAQTMDSSIESAGCTTTSKGGCDCTYAVTTLNSDTGTYSVDGTQLTFKSSTLPAQTFDYCVQGDTLYWILHSAGYGADVVFVRASGS